MSIRTAQATWNGPLKTGTGTFKLHSGWSAPYSFKTRFGEGETGTNPEELIAAAHASCYAMALSFMLEQAGFTVKAVNATASVHLDPLPAGGFAISEIVLDVNAEVPGIDEAQFMKIAQEAKENCPISKALASVKISGNYKLIG
jgi:osmotically inducible protein OsmC